MKDIFNEQHGVFISEAVQHEAIDPEIANFQAGSKGSYAPVFQNAKEAMQGGSSKAFLVPAVRFAVRSTLQVLEHEEVACQLPSEINARHEVAKKVAREVAGGAIKDRTFRRGYKKGGMPRLKQSDNYTRLYSSQYLGNVSASAFKDTSWAAGGAFKLLETQSVAVEDRTRLIQRSSGLLIVSRLRDKLLPNVRIRLGTPYIHSHHMWVAGDQEDDQRVRFKPTVPMLREDNYLSRFGGCPAAKVKSDQSQDTVLQEEWRKIVGYLIPPHATVDLYAEPVSDDEQPALVQ